MNLAHERWTRYGKAMLRARPHLLALLALALPVALPAPAAAEARARVGYTQQQAFSSALRYLRIDRRYEVTERDAEAAYLLFQYTTHSSQQATFGAVELVALTDGVQVVVKLPQMPQYHEAVLRDGLIGKMREDYGPDEPKRPKEPRPETPDEEPPPEEKSPKQAP